MGTALDFIAEHLPEVTVDDVRRRFSTVEIRDETVFAAELQEFVRENVAALRYLLPGGQTAEGAAPRTPAGAPVPVQRPAAGSAAIRLALAGKAGALVATTRWQPSATDIQRGRALLLEAYDAPSNLPIPRFAELSGKVRQQVYADIAARRLLSISIGPRKQRVPDWQLDSTGLALTRAVLAAAPDVDNWTLYKALSEPLAALDGRAPVEAVAAHTVEKITETVLNVLGIIPAGARP